MAEFKCVYCNEVTKDPDSIVKCPANPGRYHSYERGRGFKGQRDDSPAPKHPAPDTF